MKELLNLSLNEIIRDWRVWLVCGLFFAIGMLALNDTIVYNPDSARYLVWARSLSHFKGFADLSIPEPFHYVVHAPLYSILLVPAALLAPGSIVAAKVLTLLLGTLLLVLMYWWLRERVSAGIALWSCFVLAIHPLMVLFSNQILSDVPFAVAMVAAFLIVERLASGSDERLQELLPLAAVLIAGIFLREVGITLYLAAVLYFAARREFRSAAFIFIVPMIFYLLWFLRNEVIVAGLEHPPLRNSEIFTLHYFTDRQASLISELVARMKINGSIYWSHVLNLVFLPQYGTTPYGVFVRSAAPFSTVMSIAGPFHLVIGILTLGMAAYGVVVSAAKNPSTGYFLAFIPVYLLLIFFYPINDVRFLFPLLLFLVYYGAQGVHAVLQNRRVLARKSITYPIAAAAALLLFGPNFSWSVAFVRDNMRYRSSPEAFYNSIIEDPEFPDLLTKPTGAVGTWLRDHHADSSTVLTQWKELTFSLPHGKLVEVNTLTPLDEFERLIRDYRIEYVMSAVGLAGIPEFYAQMALSTRYHFEEVYRASNLEVFRVSWAAPGEKAGVSLSPKLTDTTEFSPTVRRVWAEQFANRDLFVRGLRAIAEGRTDTAKAILRDLSVRTKGSLIVVLHLAIAHEFSGEYEQAQELLEGLQRVKQSGAFLGHSTDHLEIISLLERARWEKNPELKAQYYHVVSIKLWGLGFRRQAFDALGECLRADHRFPPGLIFELYFHLEQGRLDSARNYLNRLALAQPGHMLIAEFGTVLSCRDSLRLVLPQGRKSELHLRAARALLRAGLADAAIDEVQALVRSEPSYVNGWTMLSDLYSSRFRYEPALWARERAAELDPTDAMTVREIQELKARW